MTKYILDACAVVALFQKETGADMVENLLVKAMNGRCIVSMHRMNLLEVYYGYLRDDGSTVADKHISAIESSCINIIETIPKNLMLKAGEVKVRHRMSLADSILIAQGILDKALVVTSDHHELDSVDAIKDAEFFWFR